MGIYENKIKNGQEDFKFILNYFFSFFHIQGRKEDIQALQITLKEWF